MMTDSRGTNTCLGRSKMRWPGLCILLAALVVWILYLWDISENPTFLTPIVDARAHRKIATSLLAGEVPEDLFWRSVFYPLYLYVVFFLSGKSILAAKVFQALLGAVTSWLAYHLGKAHFGSRVGIVAGVLTILCGPLLFWESELVAAGWASFWSLLLIWLVLRTADRATLPDCLALGLCGALAVLTRPSFLPFVLLSMGWLCVSFWRRFADPRPVAARFALALIGFSLLTGLVSIQAQRVTGEARFLPAAGTLNLYIGNNSDRCKTLLIRPGREWVELRQRPVAAGHVRPAARTRFFRDEVARYAADDPLGFAKGMGHKLLQLANGRELPRNIDIYDYREWSILQRVLTWKIVRFGFPWGALFPLALIGIFWGWRRIPPPLLLFVVTYPLVIIATFVAGRYRAPLLPVVSILAALGIVEIASRIRRGKHRSAGAAICLGIAIAVVTSLPGRSCEEEFDHRSEMYIFLASEAGTASEARALYETALLSSPESVRAHHQLANHLVEMKEYDQAIAHYDEAIRLHPDHSLIYRRGRAYLLANQLLRAIRDFAGAIALRPDLPQSYLLRGRAFYRLGEYGKARRDWEKALANSRNKSEADLARKDLERIDRNEP